MQGKNGRASARLGFASCPVSLPLASRPGKVTYLTPQADSRISNLQYNQACMAFMCMPNAVTAATQAQAAPAFLEQTLDTPAVHQAVGHIVVHFLLRCILLNHAMPQAGAFAILCLGLAVEKFAATAFAGTCVSTSPATASMAAHTSAHGATAPTPQATLKSAVALSATAQILEAITSQPDRS